MFLHENGHLISTTPKGCRSEGSYTLASGDAPKKVCDSHTTNPDRQTVKPTYDHRLFAGTQHIV